MMESFVDEFEVDLIDQDDEGFGEESLDGPTLRRFALQDLPTTTRGSQSLSNLGLIPESYLTPPEEEVIHQRNKRLCTPCRPPALFDEEGNEATPARDVSLLQMARKRLLLTPENSPIKSPDSKRPRIQSERVPLNTELSGYTQKQLVEVIDRLVSLHPCLEEEIRMKLPSPDLRPLENQLLTLRKNIYRAFPTTRWSSSRDAHCFRRVKAHLHSFKKTCLEQAKGLVAAQCWEAVIRYVIMAWKYTSKLPDWEDPSHNVIKAQCFAVLASQCMTALKNGDFTMEQLSRFHKKLINACSLNRGLHPCVGYVEKFFPTVCSVSQTQSE